MNPTINIKECFSFNLFWDVDINDLDPDKHRRYIIQRVIEFGTLGDWNQIKEYYGLDQIGKEMKEARSLDDVSLSFLSLATGISKENFRCYSTKQSHRQHWNF